MATREKQMKRVLSMFFAAMLFAVGFGGENKAAAHSKEGVAVANGEALQCTSRSDDADLQTMLGLPETQTATQVDYPSCQYCWDNYYRCVATCALNCGPPGSIMCIACVERGCKRGRDNCLAHCIP